MSKDGEVNNIDNDQIIFDKYKVIQNIGSGGFGKIFLVVKKEGEDKTTYILKTLREDKKGEDEIFYFHKEMKILDQLIREPNGYKYIPRLQEFNKGDIDSNENEIKEENQESKINEPYFVIDYISRGNLFYYIEISNGGLSEKCAKVVFRKILEAIQFCHESNICHLDIKPANFIFDKDFTPIIIDFGLSEIMNSPLLYGNQGTDEFKCPEMSEKGCYNGKSADVFSLGALLFNLVTGKVGFYFASEEDEDYQLIMNELYEEYWNSGKRKDLKELSNEFKELYVNMVAYEPTSRPEIDDILNSNPWLNDTNQSEELEDEIQTELGELYKKIINMNEELIPNTKIEQLGYNITRGDNENESYFNEPNIKPKIIHNDRICVNHFVKINGTINPVEFFNILIKRIKKTFEDNFIEVSDSSFKFEVSITFEEKKKTKECSMEIELFEQENDGYLVEFLRTGGQIPDYYKLFLKIKEIIKKILD